MTALFFLGIIALWLIASPWLALRLGNLVSSSRWRLPVKLAILVSLLSAPFLDEAIGMRQYDALCKRNGIEAADVSAARGKKVKVEYGARSPVSGTMVPIQESDETFRDAVSGEALIRTKNYYADGGWLMRYTWFSMGGSGPMLFGGSTCDKRREAEIFKAHEIGFLYR